MSQSLQRLYIPVPFAANGEVDPDPGQAHYLLHVLRLNRNSKILVFNGRDGEWLGEIVDCGRNRCRLQLLEQVRAQTAGQDLDYLFAPLKQARQDYMVQKAVELGVSSLQPVITARTVAPRINPKRMQANAIEAAEQCGILTLPDIRPAVKLQALLENWNEERAIIFCDEGASLSSPLSAIENLQGRKISVLIGPEGGFSSEERSVLRSKTFVSAISLGPRVMRADTAAVAALALVNAVLGDWR
jgi:16S rRNA (uracil1498-N3)-methyltransferase